MTNKIIPIWERGQEGGKTRPINTNVLFDNLFVVTQVLKQCGVRYWLSHGTMLGAYRDNSLIPWDDDADIGLDMSTRDNMDEAIKILRNKGFFIPPEGNKNIPISPDNMPWYDTVFIRNGEKVEGWWFEKEVVNGKVYYTYDRPRCGNDLRHEARYYNKLKKFMFRECEFFIPNHIEAWLVMMYDKTWNTPIKGKKYNNRVYKD